MECFGICLNSEKHFGGCTSYNLLLALLLFQPRRAKHSLAESSQKTPVPVIESLEFGGDNAETMPLQQEELDGLAENFENFHLDGKKMDLHSDAKVNCVF